ncbi:DUF4240 domain-containing protein [Nonomuraea solani]|uniref:DUF4240 domain-containing protein n=1 Tax=Nonomuraea solani TaxID=1144553 RepID=UPI00190E80FD|nr:DUF4240 domain-containing protein [Nonomuraea solani]
MTRDEFWAILAERPTLDELVATLSRLTAREIAAFDGHLADCRLAAHRADLWGAAYLINNGCSDDGFDYFRCWLVAQGRAVYEAALADPDSLAGHGPVRSSIAGDLGACEYEDFMYAPEWAHRQLTGRGLPEGGGAYPRLGRFWDFNDDDEMRRRYPRLMALLDESDAIA